jgi:hypothetical protein
MNRNILRVYYAATLLFVALDYGMDINVRAAFLENAPGLRFAFYLVLFACFALTLWRPQWTTRVGTVESLVTLVALIINMAMRSMLVTDEMIATGQGVVTMAEIINFVIAGGAAYVAYVRGMKHLQPGSGSR